MNDKSVGKCFSLLTCKPPNRGGSLKSVADMLGSRQKLRQTNHPGRNPFRVAQAISGTLRIQKPSKTVSS